MKTIQEDKAREYRIVMDVNSTHKGQHVGWGIDKDTLRRIFREELERLKALSRRDVSGGDFYNSLGTRRSKRFVKALVVSTPGGRHCFVMPSACWESERPPLSTRKR